MAKTAYPASFPASEFEVIETALMETARGRWFLAEYARKNRTADTELLLDAIARLESSLTEPLVPHELDRIRMDLMEISETIARVHQEIASVHADEDTNVPVFAAQDILDAIVEASEKATADTHSAAEQVQDAAWRLRQTDAAAAICDELDQLASRIHDASSLQDVNRQRTNKAVDLLRHLELRVNNMINVWSLDDIEMVQEEDERIPFEAPMLQGRAETLDVHEGALDDQGQQRDQSPGLSTSIDIGFAPEDEPVDLEALPRVAPYDVDTQDADSPETDVVSVGTPMPENAAYEEASESQSADTETGPVAETAPVVQASAPSPSSEAFLEDDCDLFESDDLPAAPLEAQIEPDAPAPEFAEPDSDDAASTKALAPLADTPVTAQTAPAEQVETEADSPAARSTADRINRLTPDERIALFS